MFSNDVSDMYDPESEQGLYELPYDQVENMEQEAEQAVRRQERADELRKAREEDGEADDQGRDFE